MHKNIIYKYSLLISVFAFLFFSFSSSIFAVNYGAGLYSSGFYSTVAPSDPVATPVAGSYNSTQSVTITANGSTYVRYSTTETPADCSNGTLYDSAILVSSSQTIYARACNSYNNTSTANFAYVIDTTSPETPVAAPVAETYSTIRSITLTAIGSDYIKYSVTEVPATCSAGTLYENPISVTSSTTIYTRACDNAGNSSTANFAYIIRNKKFGSTTTATSLFLAQQAQQRAQQQASTTISLASNITRTLKQGIIGDDVKSLQVYLNIHGYPVSTVGPGSLGQETSFFGPKTKASVILFQKANGLDSDGIVGPLTREYVNQSQPPVTTLPTDSAIFGTGTLKQGTTGSDVKSLQVYLNAQGYDCGTADGAFGPKTKASVILFQKANGLDSDGIVGPMTRKVME